MKGNDNIINWGILFLLAFIWGSSFILMKKGLEAFSYIQVADLRMSIAFMSLAPFIWKYIKKTPRKIWIPLIVVGLFGNGIPAFLFTKAQTHINSSLSGILNSLVPIFTLLIAVFVFKTKMKKHHFFGILIGFIGATWLIAKDGISLDNIYYSWLIIIATICYAISINTIKVFLNTINPIQISALAFLSIGPSTIIHLFTTDFLDIMNNNPQAWNSFGYILILSIIATSIAVVIFNKLVIRTSVIFAASVTYLIPVFAIMWGIIDGENITSEHFIGTGIIFAGIYLVNKE